jgi:hypothetical protein
MTGDELMSLGRWEILPNLKAWRTERCKLIWDWERERDFELHCCFTLERKFYLQGKAFFLISRFVSLSDQKGTQL